MKSQILHALFQNYFGSDQHSILLAENEEQAKEKIKFRLKGSPVEILTDAEFKERFPSGIEFMVVYYENGGGEKFCILATSSGKEKEAIQLFKQKFPTADPIKIISYKEYKKKLASKKKQKQEKTISSTTIPLCDITAAPYNSAA